MTPLETVARELDAYFGPAADALGLPILGGDKAKDTEV